MEYKALENWYLEAFFLLLPRHQSPTMQQHYAQLVYTNTAFDTNTVYQQYAQTS